MYEYNSDNVQLLLLCCAETPELFASEKIALYELIKK